LSVGRIIARLGLVVATLVACIALSEVAYRAAGKVVCIGRGDVLYTPDPRLGWRHVPGRSGWQRLEGNLYLLRRLRRVLRSNDPIAGSARTYPIELDVLAVPPQPLWLDAWASTEVLITELRRMVESGGARFAVVVMPGRESADSRWLGLWPAAPGPDGTQRWDVDYPRERLASFLKRENIPFFDLTDTIRRRGASDDEPEWFFQFDPHLTERGHRAVAQALVPFVADQLREKTDDAGL
jgi:hypothetical protein